MKKLFATASRFLDKKNVIPVLGAFKLDFDGERLTVTATNLDKSFVGVTECHTPQGTALVDGNRLSNFISKVDDFTFELGDALTVKRKGGSAKFLLMRDDYPVLPTAPDASIVVETEVLRETFQAVLCGTDEERYNTASWQNVAEFVASNGKFRCTSADGKRIVVVNGECMGDWKAYIPIMAVKTMLPILSGESVGIAEDANHLFFLTDDGQFAFRKMTVQFPDVQSHLSKLNFEEAFKVDAEYLLQKIEIVNSLVDARLLSMKWTLGENVTFSINNAEVGYAEERLGVVPSIRFETGYNTTWLLSVVRQLIGEVSCQFADAGSNNRMLRVQKQGSVECNYLLSSLTVRN